MPRHTASRTPRLSIGVAITMATTGSMMCTPRDSFAQATSPSSGSQSRAANPLAQGIAAFEAHDYERALRFFQDAYLARQDPAILFNIAATLDRLDRLPEAMEALQTYLRRASDPEGRRLAESRLEALRARVAASSPSPAPSTASSSPAVPPVVAPPPREERANLVPGLVVGTLGVAALAAGAIVFALAPDPGLDPNVNTEQRYREAARASDVQRIVGGVVGGLGIAAIAVGAVLLVTSRSSGSSRRAQLFYVAPNEAGASIGVVHVF